MLKRELRLSFLCLVKLFYVISTEAIAEWRDLKRFLDYA